MKRSILIFLLLLLVGSIQSFDPDRRTIIANPIAPPHWTLERESNKHDIITFKLLLKQNNLNKLEEYFWMVSDPKSPVYQEYLTREEILELTQPEKNIFEEVLEYLTAYQIERDECTIHDDFIKVSTDAKKVEALFQTKVARYKNSKNGNVRNRIVGPASLPSDLLKDHVDFVIGLSEFLDHKNKVHGYDLKENYDNSDRLGDDILITPGVLKSYYNVPTGQKGSAENNYQGIAAFSDYFSIGALQEFDKFYSIPTPNVTRNGSDCLSAGCDQYESDLDVQYMTAMGEGIPTIFMAHQDGAWILDYLQDVLGSNNPPLVHSISYGWAELEQCEVTDGCATFGYNSVQYVTRCDQEFQKLGTMGISVFVSDGDDGAPSLGGSSGNCPLDRGTYCPTGCSSGHTTSQCSELTFEYSNGSLCFFPAGIGSDACSSFLNDPVLQEALDKFADSNKNCNLAFEQDRTNLPHVYSSCQCAKLSNVTVKDITIGPYYYYPENGAIFLAEFPSSSPYVTSVGATQFLSRNQNISQELAASILSGAKITTGGGFSSFQPQPQYQAKSVSAYLAGASAQLPPSYSYNPSMRAYPDIALNGHNYNIFASTNQADQDKCPCSALPVDGTSCSSPALAGMISLVNDKLLSSGKKPLGFLNPLLYQMAVDCPQCFNDITVGNNRCNRAYCCLYGWNAADNWDPVSGLGSINFEEFQNYVLQQQGLI